MTPNQLVHGVITIGKQLLLPDPDHILQNVSGIVHIGANQGQERWRYARYGLAVVWVEADPGTYERLTTRIKAFPRQKAFCQLLADRDGDQYEFKVSSNGGQSSSIFERSLHKEIWDGIECVKKVSLTSMTFATLVKKYEIDLRNYQALTLDTEGAELLILKGAGDLLRNFRYIKTEAADFQAFQGSCVLGEIDAYVTGLGFREMSRRKFNEHPTAGAFYDVIYERED